MKSCFLSPPLPKLFWPFERPPSGVWFVDSFNERRVASVSTECAVEMFRADLVPPSADICVFSSGLVLVWSSLGWEEYSLFRERLSA
jgi:hypothetical protein